MKTLIKLIDSQELFEEISTFFVENITPDYISHSEVLFWRADDFQTFNPNLKSVVYEELMSSLKRDDLKVLVLENETSSIVWVALISIIKNSKKIFTILDDIIIDKNFRGQSLWHIFVEEIIKFCKELWAEMILLESWIHNEKAHHFFEEFGFKEISKSYVLPLK